MKEVALNLSKPKMSMILYQKRRVLNVLVGWERGICLELHREEVF